MDEIYKLVKEFEQTVPLEQRLTIQEYEDWLIYKEQQQILTIAKEILEDEKLFWLTYLELEKGNFDKDSEIGSELYMRLVAKQHLRTDSLNHAIRQMQKSYIDLKKGDIKPRPYKFSKYNKK
ncbi:MAG: hypothetical protein AABW84_02200 [Nanoarchaeota archaeon]